jgi:hypothetical protein
VGKGEEKLDVSSWKFLKVGAIAMPMALFAAVGGATVRMYAGLTLVNKIGAGPFVGLTVTAALGRRHHTRSQVLKFGSFAARRVSILRMGALSGAETEKGSPVIPLFTKRTRADGMLGGNL